MDYKEYFFDSSGRVSMNEVKNAPSEFEPSFAAESRRLGTHLCWIASLGKCGYQCRCSCGKRFGVHRYPMAQVGAQRDSMAHRMNYGQSGDLLFEIEGIDHKLNQLAWE